jgi:Putative DNA-binding domain
MSGGQFTDHARDRLFREIVAFANASGGTLVLGVDEIAGNPPRANAIVAIPRVHDLAARLADAARACIEPPLGGLQISGIVTEGADDGVVVFRTVASAFGPHRVAGDGHAFIRRGASSVKMTMREIQDLTIDLARGADRLEALFKNRATNFGKWFNRPQPADATGLRVTAVPTAALPQLIKVPRRTDVPLRTRQFVEFEGGDKFEVVVPGLHRGTRPILRGWRRFEEDDKRATQIDVLDGGVVDLWFWSIPLDRTEDFHLGWILGAVLLVIDVAEWFRSRAEVPEWEYAIEFELQTREPRTLLRIAPFGHHETVDISAPLLFPRIAWQAIGEKEDVLNLVFQDVLDAGGERQEWPRIKLADAVDPRALRPA